MHEPDFSNGKISTTMIKISLPIMLAEVVSLLYSMVDRIFIGHMEGVGALALTGLGLCFPVIQLVNAFARLFGSNGGAPLSAIERGRQNKEEANKILGSSFSMSLITGGSLTLITFCFMRPLLYLFGASDSTYSFARDYLSIYNIGTIPVIITLTLNAFINSLGLTGAGMMTILIGAVLNIILDPIFIFKLGLGIKGAAIATVISQSASALFTLVFLTRKGFDLQIQIKHMGLKKKRCVKIMTLGLSGFTMGATNSLVQIVCSRTALRWGGDLFVGVMAVMNSVREIFTTPINGLTSAAGPMMSYNYGAGNGKRVRETSNYLLKITIIVSAMIWGIVFTFPTVFASLFTSDVAMIETSKHALKIYFFGFVFMAFQSTGQQTFVALGKARHAIFFSLLRKLFIVVPLTLLLPFIFGADGILMAEPISNAAGGLAAYFTMRHVVMPELERLEK